MPGYNNINSGDTVTALQTQQILHRLSIAIESLDKTQRELSLDKKLDPQLKGLADKYNNNPIAIQSVYNNLRKELYDSEVAPLQMTIQQQSEQIAQLNNQINLAYASQATLSSNDVIGGLVQQGNIGALNDMSANYQKQFNPILPSLASSNAYSQYFTGSIAPLTPNATFGITPNIGNMGSANMGFAFQSGLADKFRIQMQQTGDPAMYGAYAEYNKDMMQRSQKAALNYNFSEALGMQSLIPTAEFEQGYVPAVNNMADVLNVDLDNALKIVRKMKDIHALTADVTSGRAEQIALGVDETLKVINAVSRIVGSSDLKQIMRSTSMISNFGGGNFKTGLETMFQATGQEPGTKLSMSEIMNQYTGQYVNKFGYSGAAIRMGQFHQGLQGDISQFGQYGDSGFRSLGDVRGVTGLTTSFLANELNNPMLMMTNAGSGNMFAGADALAAEAAGDPAAFMLGRSSRMYDLRNQYSGSASLDMIRDRMNMYQSQMPGLSEDEILLAVARGNPNVANALRMSMKAQDDRTQEQIEMLTRGNQLFNYSGRQFLNLSDLRDRMNTSYQGYTSEPYRSGVFDFTLATNLFGGITKSFGRAAEDVNYYGRSIVDFGKDVVNYMSSGTLSMSAAEASEANMSNFIDANGKIVRREFNESVGSSAINTTKLNQYNQYAMLASAVSTDEAIGKMEEIASDPTIGGFIDSNMIKEVLRSGVFGLAKMSDVDRGAIDALFTLIDSVSVEEIHRNIKGLLTPDSTFMILLSRAVGLGGSRFIGGIETTNRNIILNNLISGGMGSAEAEEMARGGVSWKQSNANIRRLLNQNEAATEVVGTVASLAVGGLAGAAFSIPGMIIGSIASQTAVEAYPEISEGVRQATEYVHTQTTDFVDVEELTEFYGDTTTTRATKDIYVIFSVLAEAVNRGFKNITNQGMKRVVLKIFQAILNNAAQIAQNKDIKPPIPDGVIAKVSEQILNTYENDFDTRERGRIAIREILITMLDPSGTFYNDLKKKRANAILREAQTVLETNMQEIGAWLFRDTKQATISNLFERTEGLETGTLSGILNQLASAPSDLSLARNIAMVESEATSKLNAAGESEASIQTTQNVIRDVVGFITGETDVEPSITEEQYGLLEKALGKSVAQSMKSIIDKDLTETETRNRLGKLYTERIQDPAKKAEEEKVLKSQIYGELLMGALEYVKNSGRVDQVKDTLEDLGLA